MWLRRVARHLLVAAAARRRRVRVPHVRRGRSALRVRVRRVAGLSGRVVGTRRGGHLHLRIVRGRVIRSSLIHVRGTRVCTSYRVGPSTTSSITATWCLHRIPHRLRQWVLVPAVVARARRAVATMRLLSPGCLFLQKCLEASIRFLLLFALLANLALLAFQCDLLLPVLLSLLLRCALLCVPWLEDPLVYHDVFIRTKATTLLVGRRGQFLGLSLVHPGAALARRRLWTGLRTASDAIRVRRHAPCRLELRLVVLPRGVDDVAVTKIVGVTKTSHSEVAPIEQRVSEDRRTAEEGRKEGTGEKGADRRRVGRKRRMAAKHKHECD